MIFQVDKILNCISMNTFFFLLNTVNPKLEVHKFPYFRILVNLEINASISIFFNSYF